LDKGILPARAILNIVMSFIQHTIVKQTVSITILYTTQTTTKTKTQQTPFCG
jgi:hypothetical protein